MGLLPDHGRYMEGRGLCWYVGFCVGARTGRVREQARAVELADLVKSLMCQHDACELCAGFVEGDEPCECEECEHQAPDIAVVDVPWPAVLV